jgi:hypothetical protein
MADKLEISPEQKRAFAEIARLMRDWCSSLHARDVAFNKAIDAKIAAQPSGWGVSDAVRAKVDQLYRQRRIPRSMTWVKSYTAGASALFEGSEKMDTGVALMMFSNFASAEHPEDQVIGERLLELVRKAKGQPESGPVADWLPERVASMAITGRTPGP